MCYPSNCTSWHQSMDMGVVAAVKRRYMRRLLRFRVSTMAEVDTQCAQVTEGRMGSGTMDLMEGRYVHVVDATKLPCDAWKDLTECTIAR